MDRGRDNEEAGLCLDKAKIRRMVRSFGLDEEGDVNFFNGEQSRILWSSAQYEHDFSLLNVIYTNRQKTYSCIENVGPIQSYSHT